MSMFDRIIMILTGAIYLTIGFLIITRPKLLYYGVATAFFVQGISSFLRAVGVSKKG